SRPSARPSAWRLGSRLRSDAGGLVVLPLAEASLLVLLGVLLGKLLLALAEAAVVLALGVVLGDVLLALAEPPDRLLFGEDLGRGLALGEAVGGLLGTGGMFGDSGSRL